MPRIAQTLGHELVALPDVLPPANGSVLLVGQGLVLSFPPDVLVVRRQWGEAVGELKHFDRVILLAGRTCPNPEEAVRQAAQLVRNDGFLVLVAARPWVWGLRGSVWWRGLPRRLWLGWLKQHRWVVAEETTIGFPHSFWRRIFPRAGAVWVVLAQKRVGGVRVSGEAFHPLDVALKKPVPGACLDLP